MKLRARAGQGPAFLECLAERFSSHSTPTRETRSAEAMAAARARCPIERLAGQLAAEGWTGRAALQAEVDAEVARATALADAAPFPDPAEALSDVV